MKNERVRVGVIYFAELLNLANTALQEGWCFDDYCIVESIPGEPITLSICDKEDIDDNICLSLH